MIVLERGVWETANTHSTGHMSDTRHQRGWRTGRTSVAAGLQHVSILTFGLNDLLIALIRFAGINGWGTGNLATGAYTSQKNQ